jgi:hypothetical protein
MQRQATAEDVARCSWSSVNATASGEGTARPPLVSVQNGLLNFPKFYASFSPNKPDALSLTQYTSAKSNIVAIVVASEDVLLEVASSPIARGCCALLSNLRSNVPRVSRIPGDFTLVRVAGRWCVNLSTGTTETPLCTSTLPGTSHGRLFFRSRLPEQPTGPSGECHSQEASSHLQGTFLRGQDQI